MKSMIKTTLELFKGDGVYRTDHLDRNRLVSLSRSYRLSNGSNRVSRAGIIHCKRLSITKTVKTGDVYLAYPLSYENKTVTQS
ncbi:unnamed protein product [Eruca vesicaria subsp. sativa]|uniref:Uncharacterized protein n=1 Tax=Eruca vesicaria subsp. sativa TaxID=29727 RepID=A0ABC8JG01_ERUVS|nr:unnamed protein product [Eruca vesicaria subsp. sativa]